MYLCRLMASFHKSFFGLLLTVIWLTFFLFEINKVSFPRMHPPMGRAFQTCFTDKVTVIHTHTHTYDYFILPFHHLIIENTLPFITCRGLQEPAESRGKYSLRASEECFWNRDVNHLGWDNLCQTTHDPFQQRAALQDNGRKVYWCLEKAAARKPGEKTGKGKDGSVGFTCCWEAFLICINHKGGDCLECFKHPAEQK